MNTMEISQILGENLKRLRTARNLSLGQLADRCGVSKVMLSRMERGESNPTVNTLWKIVNGLGVSYSALMERQTTSTNVVRRDEVPVQSDDNGSYHLACYFANTPERGFEIYRDTLDAGATHKTNGHGPGTEEFFCLEQGRLTITVGGQAHTLETGDAISFDASLPHCYEALGDEPAIMMMDITFQPRCSIGCDLTA
jgi:transcriptional regulator with XRE-family HTH domain